MIEESKQAKEDNYTCSHCGESSCIWFYYRDDVVEAVHNWVDSNTTSNGYRPSNNLIRKECYQIFIRMHHGFLGKGKRKKIPECVLNCIRCLYPDDDGEYMGFKDE